MTTKFGNFLAAVTVISSAQAAFGAEMEATALFEAPAAAPTYNWTGCHIGSQIGWAWQRDRGSELLNGAASDFQPLETADSSGLKIGGMLGCNWQSGQWVFGIEGDAEYADLEGNADYFTPGAPPPDSYDIRTSWQGSARGRIGYAFDRNLLYVTGGLTLAHIEYTYFQNSPSSTESFDKTRVGWTVGSGLEHVFSDNWTGRIEYRYSDFGSVSNDTSIYADGFVEQHETTEHSARVGVAYRFFGR